MLTRLLATVLTASAVLVPATAMADEPADVVAAALPSTAVAMGDRSSPVGGASPGLERQLQSRPTSIAADGART